MRGLWVITLFWAFLSPVLGDVAKSMILSSREIDPVITTTTFIEKFKQAQEDLLIVVSIYGLHSPPALDGSLKEKLHLSSSILVEDNCTLLNEVLESVGNDVGLKEANSLDSLDIAKSGFWLYQAPFDSRAIEKVGSVATGLSINCRVDVVVSQCPIHVRIHSAAMPRPALLEKSGKEQIRMTPLIMQQMLLFAFFLLVLITGISWTISIKVPEALLHPKQIKKQ